MLTYIKDMVRASVLYHQGGLYMDADFVVVGDLGEVCQSLSVSLSLSLSMCMYMYIYIHMCIHIHIHYMYVYIYIYIYIHMCIFID